MFDSERQSSRRRVPQLSQDGNLCTDEREVPIVEGIVAGRRQMQMVMLAGFAQLLIYQIAGEGIVVGLRLMLPPLAFPGPVAGMLLLVAVLAIRRRLDVVLDSASAGLISILSLLFVPSAVGIMQYRDLILGWGGPLLLAIGVSTLLTLMVTVGTYLGLARLLKQQSL